MPIFAPPIRKILAPGVVCFPQHACTCQVKEPTSKRVAVPLSTKPRCQAGGKVKVRLTTGMAPGVKEELGTETLLKVFSGKIHAIPGFRQDWAFSVNQTVS